MEPKQQNIATDETGRRWREAASCIKSAAEVPPARPPAPGTGRQALIERSNDGPPKALGLMAEPLLDAAPNNGQARRRERDDLIVNIRRAEGRVIDAMQAIRAALSSPVGETPAPERCGFVHADGWTCGRAAGHPSVHVPPSRMAAPPQSKPEAVAGQCPNCGERDGAHGAWCRR